MDITQDNTEVLRDECTRHDCNIDHEYIIQTLTDTVTTIHIRNLFAS
jgi:hypothetical protein